MRVARISFQLRWWPLLSVVAGVALFVNLGLWQAGKAEMRQREIAQFTQRARLGPYAVGAILVDPETLQDAPVAVRGIYEPEKQFFIDNRQENGKAGVHVLTPLRIDGSETRVLVNRGWVGWGRTRDALPVVDVPKGVVLIHGIASRPSSKKFFLMPEREQPQDMLWSRVDLQRFATRYNVPLQGFVILQNPADATDALVRNWPPPEDRVAMHQSYSMQWFGIAIALVVFFCGASLRVRGKE